MNCTATLHDSAHLLRLDFSLSPAAWQEIVADNVSIMAVDDKIGVFSFVTGAMLTSASHDNCLNKIMQGTKPCALQRQTGDKEPSDDSLLFKFERFDLTGQFAEGIRAQATGNTAAAIANYQQVIAADARIGRVYNLLGLCQRINNDTGAAEESYRLATKFYGEAPDAWCNLGIFYQKTGQDLEAQNYFTEALKRDEFYYNALIRRVSWFLETGQVANPEFARLNLRLLMNFSELAIVQRHIMNSAERLDMSLEQYCEKLHSDHGILANSKIQQYCRRIESGINNGAFASAAEYMVMLNDMTPEMHGEQLIRDWLRPRIEKVQKRFASDATYSFIEKLHNLAENCRPAQTNDKSGHAPLTGSEFFSMVLLEVMRDGQIEPAEQELLKKLKAALNVPDQLFMQMFNNVRKQLAGAEVSDGLRERFSHQRLFRNLCQAACRDGIIEEPEKKILGFACKAFGISSEEFKRIIAEVVK
ncbi:MAG: hypothetical protein CVV41_14550 [Candidatus Riflebacteria bacterium HGW-Riflebacteria-1]|jgi:tetratricopeptide (TPR) repeat protein|nr:MAG: hypothetical protein CVV41_14550 [Candidatus Riflebacteria bacterium HGW-Riflebacteria-1]